LSHAFSPHGEFLKKCFLLWKNLNLCKNRE
jgi:hypothetical protein